MSGLMLAGLIVALRSNAVAPAQASLRVLGGNAVLAFLLCTLMSRISAFRFWQREGN